MKRKRARKNKPNIRHAVKAFVWLVVVVGMTSAALWEWHRGHRQIISHYEEPGWTPARPSDRWKCIVIHHSASQFGGAVRINAWHKARGWEGLGYHFVVGNGTDTADGQVEIGFRWAGQFQGAHCKTDDQYYNNHGIGICLVGNFNNHPPSENQMQSLARLVRFLCARFNIPSSAIYTHGGVTGKTECPGRDFDLAMLIKMIRTE